MIPGILLIVFVQHPFHTKIISEFIIFLQTAVLGVSNGITGSVPMIYAPAKVIEERRELAGKNYVFIKIKLNFLCIFFHALNIARKQFLS